MTLLACLGLCTTAQALPQVSDVIDFEGLPAGSVVSAVSGAAGSGPVGVFATNATPGHPELAIVFDSANPTGADFDLGTPNEDFGGPGMGSGGSLGGPFQNDMPLGGMLIVAENDIDQDADGLVDDPDDEAGGGKLRFDFSGLGPVEIESLTVLDIEDASSVVHLLDASSTVMTTVPLPQTGDNGVGLVTLAVSGVDALEVVLTGGGAIDDIRFRTAPPACTGMIGDLVWDDLDGNGLQDPGEPGLPGVSIRLRNGGMLIASTITDADGAYLFTGLCAGAYELEVDAAGLPAGSVQSPCDVGADDTLDNDCSPVTVVLPADDTVDRSVDFGFTAAAPHVLASAREPGSAGIFTVQRSGLQPEGGAVPFFTIVSVTNTNLAPATPFSVGGSTNVHYQYVNTVANPADPFKPLGCSVFDRIEFLTPGDTLSILTSCHNATAGAQQGYLVVSAQDPSQFDVDWSFNHLIGSELVVNGSGGVYALPMIALQGLTGAGADGVPHPTDDVLFGGDGDGQMDFDGKEYSAVPDVLMIDSFVALAGSQLALINLTGSVTATNTVLISAWNDNEFPMSVTLEFRCWFDQPLSAVSPLFTQAFLENATPHDPGELDLTCNGTGNVETAWARIDSVGVKDAGGSPVDEDGAMLGSVTTGPTSLIDGGRLLWESFERQSNGTFLQP
ncbi:MAG: SdrD B-like domain-containing protein [Planctomycetota bacterium]